MPHADPAQFPLQTLSKSSVEDYLKCPYKWKLKHVDGLWEPSSGALIAGGAAGAAENEHFWNVIEGKDGLTAEDVLDVFSDQWKVRVDEAAERAPVAWGEAKPADVRSTAEAALAMYHEQVGSKLKPVSVEREARLRIGGMPWVFKGYLDIELDDPPSDSIVRDLKMKGKKMSAGDAAKDLQPTAYLVLRRAESNPAVRFEFDCMIRSKTPGLQLEPTTRTDAQLDAFLQRLLSVAGDIALRTEFDHWQGAPPAAWWCSEKFCGFWRECPFGGLAHTRATQATKAAGKAPSPVAA